jgi:nucleotide-binding universal stress UspA family protein
MIIEKLCVATDGSDVAVRAAQLAALLAHTGARRMLALSVAQPQFSMAPEAASDGGLATAVERALASARAHVETVARIAAAHGIACETAVRLGSSPGPEIVSTAEAYGCDLIVMGSHGPSAMERGYAGSVAQHVLASSTIPVLVLRDPREASEPEFSDEPSS